VRESGKRLRVLSSSKLGRYFCFIVLSVNSSFISINAFRVNFYRNFFGQAEFLVVNTQKNAHVNSSITSNRASKKRGLLDAFRIDWCGCSGFTTCYMPKYIR